MVEWQAPLFQPGQVAFVHDVLAFVGGAERALEAMLELFPKAPIYTLVYHAGGLKGTTITRHPIIASGLNKLPKIHRNYRSFLPLFPYLVEQFDLSDYPVVISSSYATAHGVLTNPGQVHIAYLYTPMRHAWHDNATYLRRVSARSGLAGWLAALLLHRFRLWDILAAQRPDLILAASDLVATRVQRYYRRTAQVLYPPVEVKRFIPSEDQNSYRSYYLVVSRLRPHKKVALIVEAFNRLGYPLKVVGEGTDQNHLRKRASSNVSFLGRQADDQLPDLYAGAKALVHAAEEDFGITMVEAQAAGCPVIAYGKGGAVETVLPEVTGILFPEQSVESLVEAVRRFETRSLTFDPGALRRNAGRFNKARFQDSFMKILNLEVDRSENLFSGNLTRYTAVPVHL